MRLSRGASWMLLALCAWSLWVWLTRIWIMAGQDVSAGFLAVHTALAVGSIAFGLAAGRLGWLGLRAARAREAAPGTDAPSREPTEV